jgi:hypothetical protein
MKPAINTAIHQLVVINGERILADRDAVLIGVENLTERQGQLFDGLLTMFLKEHGLSY